MMKTILQPQIIAMHRMVTGEAGRFPELGDLLYQRGLMRGFTRVANWMEQLMSKGVFRATDPMRAAHHFAGLCQSGCWQRHILGAGKPPRKAEIEADVTAAIDIFLRAYRAG